MQHYEALSYLIPSSGLPSAAFIRSQETDLCASLHGVYPSVLTSVAVAHTLSLYRIPDIVIGLSCLVIAATLITFILGAGKLLPYRVPFFLLAAVVTICGLTHMTSAVLPANPNLEPQAYLSFVAALLALLIACLLPFVLPYVLSVLRASPHNEVPAAQTSMLSIALAGAPQTSPLTVASHPPAPSTAQPAIPHAAPPTQPAAPATQRDDARLIAATESSIDSFFILSPLRDSDGKLDDFVFTWLNHNGEKLLRRSRSEILGARLSALLPIDPAPNTIDQYRLVQKTGKPYIHEFPLKEDEVYGTWMRHHVVPLEDGIAITVTDITERKHSEQYLLHLTQHDPLTGLPSRALLDDRIVQAIARANRYRSKVAVFLINLGSFRQVNVRHGHDIGDDVILAAANRLRSTIRSTDSIIRLGGDEFVVIMSDIALETDIRRAAATLVAVLLTPISIEDKAIQITCSVGISIYPDTAATVQDLLSGADVAMYRAKTQGKNMYVLFTPAAAEDTGEESQQLAG